MNPNSTNPLMFILEADPARYLKTRAAALLALLKLIEGVAAVWCVSQMIAFLRAFAADSGGALPVDAVKSVLPYELTALLPQGTLPSGGAVGTALTALAALCLLAELACLALEGFAAPYLCFALGGAKLFSVTRKTAFFASVGLALSVTLSCVVSAYDAVTGGAELRVLLWPALVTVGCALLLWLYVSYNRGASAVIAAIEYEIRLGFKESVPKELKLGRDSFFLCVIFLAAAAALCAFVDWRMYANAIPVLLALKYGVARKSWLRFRRCHR